MIGSLLCFMKKTVFILLGVLILFSCKKGDQIQTIEQVVEEWTGKTVILPDKFDCKVMGQDTLASDLFQKPYKVLLYVDSMGCTSCKLRMPEWRKIIKEADSIAPDQIGFLFFFNPKSTKELDFLMKRDRFDYPIFVDESNEIDRKNHFPRGMSFQCFLLDKNNKVLVIGNPSINPHIWDLYKVQITGEKSMKNISKTKVGIPESEMQVSGLEVGKVSKAAFGLINEGNVPLVINDIKSSCGCTVPSWNKSPIEPGQRTQIEVEIKPEESGYFHKTIDVYCNVAGDKFQLSIKGAVK